MIVRVTILGRDAKVGLHDMGGSEILALMTRDQFDEGGSGRTSGCSRGANAPSP